MIVQFNLLPDVKLEYIRAARTRRLVTAVSVIVTAVSLLLFVSLFSTVHFVQKKNSADLSKDIAAASQKLQDIPDLDRILTVQNQLNSIPSLNSQKPATERLFGYITVTTPKDVAITKLNVDFQQHTVSVAGTTSSIDKVNKYVDTLKFTKYKLTDDESAGEPRAFSNVVLSTFSRDKDMTTYTIDFNFEPAIFDATKKPELIVPSIVTTRSALEQPTDLFQNVPPTSGNGQ